jgi:hypothetical protein
MWDWDILRRGIWEWGTMFRCSDNLKDVIFVIKMKVYVFARKLRDDSELEDRDRSLS